MPKTKKTTPEQQTYLSASDGPAMPEGIIRDVDQAIEALKGCSKIGLDLETGGLDFSDPIAVFSMRGDNGVYAILHTRGYIPPQLKEFLERDGVLWVGHNFTNFDVPFMWAHGIRLGQYWDTLTIESLVDIQNRRDKSKSLKASVARRLKQTVSKDMGQHSWMVPELDAQQIIYCKEDVEYLIELQEAQQAKALEQGQQQALELELAIAPGVAYMRLNGLPIDPELWDEYVAKQQETAKEAASILIDAFGECNLDSWQQVKKAYLSLGIEIPDTKVETIEKLAYGHEDAEVRAIAEAHLTFKTANQRVKLYRAYKEKGKLKDNRVRPSYWQCGTGTLRFSSSDPNGQNFSRDMRYVFRARRGYKVVSGDFAAIEARVAFMQAFDEVGIEACKQEDIHSYVASMIFDDFGSLPPKERKTRRQQAKAAVFRFIFGGGWSGFPAYARKAYRVDITAEQAKDIHDRFFLRFTGLRRKKEEAYRRAAQGGAVKLRLPHKAIRLLAGKELTATRLLNTPVQGTAGGGMKYAIWELVNKGLHTYLAATVHDELVAEVPDAMAIKYAEELGKCMIAGMYKVLRTEMPVQVSLTVRQEWSKDEDFTMGPDLILRYAEGEHKGEPVREVTYA